MTVTASARSKGASEITPSLTRFAGASMEMTMACQSTGSSGAEYRRGVPRFVDPSGRKFWEIERDGTTIIRRSGNVGGKGRTLTRAFANPLLARWHHDNMVGYKTHTE